MFGPIFGPESMKKGLDAGVCSASRIQTLEGGSWRRADPSGKLFSTWIVEILSVPSSMEGARRFGAISRDLFLPSVYLPQDDCARAVYHPLFLLA